MKILITGLNGTVAPIVAKQFAEESHTIIAYNRNLTPIDNIAAISAFIEQTKPDWLFHLATGSPTWAANLAQITYSHSIPFLFTSSVSVFSDKQTGPLTINVKPEATDDYGRYKIECENIVLQANPNALVARLAWQIGDTPGSNHMVDFLHRQIAQQGTIYASRNWYPACSFLQDTAQAIFSLVKEHSCGIYHLDANPGFSFYQIVTALNKYLGQNWYIIPTDTPAFTNRMMDERIRVRPISERLTDLL